MPARVDVPLRDHVDAALASGATTLSEVLRIVLPRLPEPDRYRSVGRIAQRVAQVRPIFSERDPNWTAVANGLAITEWQIFGARP